MAVDSDLVSVKNRTLKGRKINADTSTKTNINLQQKFQNISDNLYQPNTGLRRSPRVPRVTLQYLEGIKAELKDPDECE